jgi:hypothetical protein
LFKSGYLLIWNWINFDIWMKFDTNVILFLKSSSFMDDKNGLIIISINKSIEFILFPVWVIPLKLDLLMLYRVLVTVRRPIRVV